MFEGPPKFNPDIPRGNPEDGSSPESKGKGQNEKLKSEREISAEQWEHRKEIVEKLEGLEFLYDTDKIIFLLVFTGEKSGGHIGIVYRLDTSDYTEEEFRNRGRKLQDFLEENKVSYYSREIEPQRATNGEIILKQLDFYLAKDIESLEKIKEAVDEHDERKFGLAMGYPQTAVEAFVSTEDPFTKPDLLFVEPIEVEFSEERSFLFFRMSKEHWHEELEVVKRWARTIKEVAPQLYEEITSQPLQKEYIDALRKEQPERFQELLNSQQALEFIRKRDEELYGELAKERLGI